MAVARVESRPPHPAYPGRTEYNVGDAIQEAYISKEIFTRHDDLSGFAEKLIRYEGYFIIGASILFDKDDLKIAKLKANTVTSGGGVKVAPIISKSSLPANYLIIPYDHIVAERGMKMVLEYNGKEYLCRLHPT